MKPSIASRKKLRARKCFAFTVIELVTVLAVIVILAALVLAAGSSPSGPRARSKAASEIQAMSTALESFKTDHDTYPPAGSLLTNYLGNDVTQSGGNYQISSQILYRALSGQTNFADKPAAGAQVYISFKRNQVSDSEGGSFVRDPSGNSYGYSTGRGTSYPYNGKGFFDFWSTAGTTGISSTDTNAWISNWQ
jgi:type II secretory pathway pseudopilin PulG